MAVNLYLSDKEAQWLANLVSSNLDNYYDNGDFKSVVMKSEDPRDCPPLSYSIGSFNDPIRGAILDRLIDTDRVTV